MPVGQLYYSSVDFYPHRVRFMTDDFFFFFFLPTIACSQGFVLLAEMECIMNFHTDNIHLS